MNGISKALHTVLPLTPTAAFPQAAATVT